jgi:hypothetical protein
MTSCVFPSLLEAPSVACLLFFTDGKRDKEYVGVALSRLNVEVEERE